MSIPRNELDQQIKEDENNTPASVAAETDELQEYQVAAGGNVLSDVAGKVGRFLFKEYDERPNVVTRPGKTVEGENPATAASQPLVIIEKGKILTRPATNEEINKLQAYQEDYDPSADIVLPNLARIGTEHDPDAAKKLPNRKPGESAYTTPTTDPTAQAEIELQEIVAATFQTYKDAVTSKGNKILRKGERGFEQIIAEADKIGSEQIFLELMKREPGDRPFTDAELLSGAKVITALQMEASRLLDIAKSTGDPIDLAKAAQAISLEGYASIQLYGVREDYGRGLATNKIISAPSKARIDAMRTMLETNQSSTPGPTAIIDGNNVHSFVEAYGGIEAMKEFLYFYDALPADASKHEFAKRSMLRRRLGDPFVEIFQSALLTNPLTHAYNTAGTAVHLELLTLERLFEGRPREALAMLSAQGKYLGQALKAGAFALRTEQAMDSVSKLDVDVRSISGEAMGFKRFDQGGGAVENTLASFFDGFGVMMRLGGFRPMLATDEFFKALSRGAQLEALAVRAETEALRTARQEGLPDNIAKGRAREAYIRTLKSEGAYEEASEFARMVTFQDDVPGTLGELQGLVSHPIIKVMLPFYKTPTQIMRRIGERTPLAVAMPSVLRDKLIKGSNAERREALARIGVGSGTIAATMLLSTGYYSDDFVITGYGPTEPKQRSIWLMNNKPYSIGIKKDDGSGFEWINYERYDPVSGVMAMAADTAYTLQFAEGQMADDLFINASLATVKYIGTALPMTQFIGEMLNVAGSPYENTEAKITRVRELLTKQYAGAGLVVGQQIGTAGLGGSGLTATLERYMDPYARDPRPDAQYDYVPGIGLQPEIRGVYEALNYARSRIPGLSKDLPIKYNRWYEPVMQVNPTTNSEGQYVGTVWQTFVPFRVMDLPNANVINSELDSLGLGFKMLPRSMNEPMLKLNGEQYRRYIELYNYPARSEFAPRGANNELPPSALEVFANAINSEDYQNLPNKGQKIKVLRAYDSQQKQLAKILMFQEFPELFALTTQRDVFSNYQGKNPKFLVPPDKGSIAFAEEQLGLRGQ